MARGIAVAAFVGGGFDIVGELCSSVLTMWLVFVQDSNELT